MLSHGSAPIAQLHSRAGVATRASRYGVLLDASGISDCARGIELPERVSMRIVANLAARCVASLSLHSKLYLLRSCGKRVKQGM